MGDVGDAGDDKDRCGEERGAKGLTGADCRVPADLEDSVEMVNAVEDLLE